MTLYAAYLLACVLGLAVVRAIGRQLDRDEAIDEDSK